MKDPFDYFSHERDESADDDKTDADAIAPYKGETKFRDLTPELEAHVFQNDDRPDELMYSEKGGTNEAWIATIDPVEVRQ